MRKIFVLIASTLIMTACSIPANSTPTAAPTPTAITVEENPIPEGSPPVGFAIQFMCQKNAPCQVDGESFPDGSQLLLYPVSGGQPVGFYLPILGDVVHISSPVDFNQPDEIEYILRGWEDNQFNIISNGAVIRSLDGTSVVQLVGAPAQQVFAFSFLPGTQDSGLSEIQVHPGMGAMVTAPGMESLVLPIKVTGNGARPPDNAYVAMYYTFEPYGIGGEILFPPYSGLFYFQGNGELHEELLSPDLQFSALSPNAHFIAYTEPPIGGIVIRDLMTGRDDLTIPLLQGSEKGAGSAVFSPDSTRLAWLEGSGSLFDGNFSPTIRIAGTDGEILAEFSAEALQQASGYANLIIRPVGWIDNQRVLLQVHVTRDYGDMLLLVANTDGTIEDSVITGKFVGLVYGEQ